MSAPLEAPRLGDMLARRGISRRALLKFCTAMASMMALPPGAVSTMAQALANARRPSVIWLSFQECTGCTESLTRSNAPTLEDLIFNLISLDYQETLQAAAGTAAAVSASSSAGSTSPAPILSSLVRMTSSRRSHSVCRPPQSSATAYTESPDR